MPALIISIGSPLWAVETQPKVSAANILRLRDRAISTFWCHRSTTRRNMLAALTFGCVSTSCFLSHDKRYGFGHYLWVAQDAVVAQAAGGAQLGPGPGAGNLLAFAERYNGVVL